MTTPTVTTNALVLLYPGYNTLDVNGPFEVLRKSGMSTNRHVTIAAQSEITTSAEGAKMQCDELINDELIANLDKYDLLIIPGGLTNNPDLGVLTVINDPQGPYMRLVQAFYNLPMTPAQPQRILLSVCTGALIVATLGIFNDRYCTTHWACYDTLNQYLIAASKTGSSPGTILPSRFVDCGGEDLVRVISSGGISCCMDATLHIVKLRDGENEAFDTAMFLDYAWRKTEGVVFGKNNLVSKP